MCRLFQLTRFLVAVAMLAPMVGCGTPPTSTQKSAASTRYEDLPENDRHTAQGFRFTGPLRTTIPDLIEAGTI